ncbi:hypothetical protein [Aquimarina algiphila]|uniref:Uncharacterized protein n=1 Tax=Aquimarina algiphila TaxID=2047982 RepID=A0A554VRJ4_9FLAO|nr:hypothetical protein [Aquimarina algiphila]TSE11266.1 hypothetical protein FOF46_01160 [Aquimarina algiphila]
MGKSKDIFLEVVQSGNLGYDSGFTKKDAQNTGRVAAQKIIEAGEVGVIEALTNVVRLKEVVTALFEELKQSKEVEDIDKMVSMQGVQFSSRNTGDLLDYEQDEVYKELKEKLADRKELLRVSYKSKDTIYDSEGIEIPKVQIKKYGSRSLVINF